ncbi:MAG: hypothetical protein AAGA85_01790 [Bacteroidota bacterium]
MTYRRIFSLFTLYFVSSQILAQDTLSIDQSFQELLRTSETYEIYKVIRTERLNSFWGAVLDSMANDQSTIEALEKTVQEQRGVAADYQQQSAAALQQAANLQEQVSTIQFVGIQMEKSAYHLLVWIIIGVLVVLLGVVFWRFKESHQVTSRAQKELESLSQEFEHHKEKARKKEVKLKRELQTMVNELESRKRGES